jgi:plasmid stabilization system protein ParE
MSVSVVVLPDARRDILAGQDFFEQLRAGLGKRFVAAVLTTLDRIGTMPELYGEVEAGVRAAGVKRFGYVTYYRTVSTGVEIIAVLHGGRDPQTWQLRI